MGLKGTLTFGMAYTKLPKDAGVEAASAEVVRKRRREVRWFVRCRWMWVCGARGRGKESSYVFGTAVPLCIIVAIMKSLKVGSLRRAWRLGNLGGLGHAKNGPCDMTSRTSGERPPS
jgi:hypothetical protein